MMFVRSSLKKNEKYNACLVLSNLVLGSIIVVNPSFAIDAGGGPRRDINELVENKECCTCTRELWRVLMGGATALASLLVSLGGWYHSDFHKNKKQIFHGFTISPFRAFLTVVAGSLVPQIFMSFVLSSALAAAVLRQRVNKSQRPLANKICTMVVWIRIDEATYKSLLQERPYSSLWAVFPAYMTSEERGQLEEAPGIEDALFFKEGKSLRGIATSPAVQYDLQYECGEHPPRSTSDPTMLIEAESTRSRYYYLCSQGWDANNRLWKETLLETTEVLPEEEELTMIQTRSKWECIVVAMQALGYLVSVLSRFAYGKGARVSSVEVMSAWISSALVVQVMIIPFLATYCNRGICLDLSDKKLRAVVDKYEQKQEKKEDMLDWYTLMVLVLSVQFLCGLSLVLIPPLVYYYYRLSSSMLTFVSLIPFTILSGFGIIAFVLTLIVPPHEVIFAFVGFPCLKPPAQSQSSKHMPIISVAILFTGFSCYLLAVIDTTMNWHLFHARDCYVSSFIIPHIGS